MTTDRTNAETPTPEGACPSPAPDATQGQPAAKWVKFQVETDPGSKVYLAGSFNGWDPTQNEMVGNKGLYSTTVLLAPGRYEYKFVIDGVWCIDPECPDRTPNGLGSLNSVVTVE